MPSKNKDLSSRWIFGETPAERKFWFNRENAIERARERLSIPTLKTCIKYKLQREELQGIFDALIETIEKKYPNDDELPKIPEGIIKKKQLDIIIEDTDTETDIETESGYTTDNSDLSFL